MLLLENIRAILTSILTKTRSGMHYQLLRGLSLVPLPTMINTMLALNCR